MTIREFAAVVVRFFGLWLLLQSIGMIEQTIVTGMTPLFKDNLGYQHFITIANGFNAILYIFLGLILTWRPQIVVDRMPFRQTGEARLRITTTGLMFLCFSVAGLVFSVDGLKVFLYLVAERALSPGGHEYVGSRPMGIIPAAFETAVGLWLLFGFKRIIPILRRIWLSGRTLGSAKTDAEK